jgi:peptidyl-tRNA hydrolase
VVSLDDIRGELGVEPTDSGKTEFPGEPTNTCLAIGPDDADKIDAVTGELQLL